MADEKRKPYIIEILADETKFIKQLKGLDWESIIGDKAKGLSELFAKEGAESRDVFVDKLMSMDIDWEKTLGSKKFKSAITKIVGDANQQLRAGLVDKKEIAGITEFIGEMNTAMAEFGTGLDTKGAVRSLTAFAKAIQPIRMEIEALANAPEKVKATVEMLSGLLGNINKDNKPIVITPFFDFAKADKGVEEIKRKLNNLNEDLDVKVDIKDVDKTIKELMQVERKISDINDELDEPDLDQSKVKELKISLANQLILQGQYFKTLRKLRKENESEVNNALKSNKYKMTASFGVRLDDLKMDLKDIIGELSKMSSSGIGEAINLSVAVPTAEDIRAAINEEIKKLNKRKDALQAVKLTVDDSIDSANNSTVEKTTDTVSKSFEKIDNVIETKTSQWREKIINAFKVNKKEIDVPFTAEASAEMVFNQVQQFFEENEIELHLNKDAIVQQLKQAIEEGGLPTGGLGGGGTVSLDPKTLASAFATGLQAFFTGDFTPVTGEKKPVKEIQEKPKRAFYLDPQNEHNQEVAKTFKAVLDYALAEGGPNKKVKGFVESKLVGSEFWDEEAKSVNLDKLANGSSIGLVSALSYITEKYGETLVDDVNQLIKDTGKNKLLNNFRGDLTELLRTQNIKQITGDEHTKDLERADIWEDYLSRGRLTAGLGKLRAKPEDLKIPEVEELVKLAKDTYGEDSPHFKQISTALDALETAHASMTDTNDADQKAKFLKAVDEFKTNTQSIYWDLRDYLKSFEWGIDVKGFKKQFGLQSASGVDRLWRAIGGDESRIVKPHLYRAPDSISSLAEQRPDRTDVLYRNTKVKDFKARENTSKKWEESSAAKEAEERIQKAKKLAEEEEKALKERYQQVTLLQDSLDDINAEISKAEAELEAVQKSIGVTSFGGKSKELTNARRRLTRRKDKVSVRDKEYQEQEKERLRAIVEQEHANETVAKLETSVGKDHWVTKKAQEQATQAANRTAEATKKSQEAKALLDQAQSELDAIQNDEWVKAVTLLDTLKQKRKDFRDTDEVLKNYVKELEAQKPESTQDQLNKSTEKIDDLIATANKAQENLDATIAEAKQVEQWVDDAIGADGYKKPEYDIKHTEKNQALFDKSLAHRRRATYLSNVADGSFAEGDFVPEDLTEKMSSAINSILKSREVIQKLSLDFGFDKFTSEDAIKNEAQRRLAENDKSEDKLHPIIQEYYQKIVGEGQNAASQWLNHTLENARVDVEKQTTKLQSFADKDSKEVQSLKPKLDEADAQLRETYQKRVNSWFNDINKKTKIVEKGEAKGATEEAKRAGALAAKEIEDIYALINKAIKNYTSYFSTPDFARKMADLSVKYAETPLTEEIKNDPVKKREVEAKNKAVKTQLEQERRKLKAEEREALEKELLAENQSVIESRDRELYSHYIAKITASSREESVKAHSAIESSERYNLLLTRQAELLAEISSATLDGKDTEELRASLSAINEELLKYQQYLTNVGEDIIKMEQKVALDRALGVPKKELDKQYADIDKARADAEKAQYEGLKKRQTDLLAQIKTNTKEGKSAEVLSQELKSVNEELLKRETTQRRLKQLGANGDLYRADIFTVEQYNKLIEEQIRLEQELALIKAQGGDASQTQKDLREQRKAVNTAIKQYQSDRIKSDAANSPYVQALDYLRETQEKYDTALQKRYAIKGRKNRVERQLDDVQNDEKYSTSWQYKKHQTEVKNRLVNEYVGSDQYKTDRTAGFGVVEKKFAGYLEETFGAEKAQQIFYEFMKNQQGKRADKFDPDKFTGTYADMMREGLGDARTDAENEFKESQIYKDLVAERDKVIKPYQDALAQAYDAINKGQEVDDAELQQKFDLIDQRLAEDVSYLKTATTQDYPLLEAEVKKLLEGTEPKNAREYEAVIEKARNNLIQQEQQRANADKKAAAYAKLQPAVASVEKETQIILQNATDDYVRQYFDKWIESATDDVFKTSGSEDVAKEFKRLLEENVYNLVKNYASSLEVKNGKLNGIDIRAEVEKRLQDELGILNQHSVETEQDIANIEKQRRAAMQFGGIKTSEIADAEVLREQAVLEAKLTLEKERQKELTDQIARLEKEGASSQELGRLGEALDKSNENVRKLEMFVANKDTLMEIQHQALKDEKVLEKLDLDQQKLYYEAKKAAAETDLESGNERVKKSAQDRLERFSGILERIDGKIAERDQIERDKHNPIKMFAGAIKEALGGTSGGLNINATGLATEATLAQILATLTGGKVVEGSARSEVAATVDKKSPEWKTLQTKANEAYQKVKDANKREWKSEEKTAIDNTIKSLIEKIQNPKTDEKTKIALQVALKDALSDFIAANKGNSKLDYKTNKSGYQTLAYEEIDKYFGYDKGTLRGLRLTDDQARKKLGGQPVKAEPKSVVAGDGGVNALAKQDTLSKILEVLNAFKSDGVKVTGKKQGEAKVKESKVEKTEAELIKERALKDKDAVLGIAATSKVKKKYEDLVKKLDSETDLGKIKALAQKTSALGFNIKKESAEWDYKTADANRVYNIPNANFFGKRKETVRKSMEKLAQTQFNPDGKQYEFLNFDGKQLVYQLTDVRGNVEKVTMEWSELNNQVAITSDKSGHKMNELAEKVRSFGEKFENAIDAGYLAENDEDLERFKNKVIEIQNEIAKGASFDDIDKLRNEALRIADEVTKKANKVKRSYSGTTDVNAATKQHDNLEFSGILDKKKIVSVKEYNNAYDELIAKHKEFKTAGTLYDSDNQKTLQMMAIGVKALGKDLEAMQTKSEDLQQKVANSGLYNGKAIGDISQVAQGTDIYEQMRAKLEELGATNIKVDRIHQRATGTIRHNNKLVSDLEVSYDELTGSLARYHKQERESLIGIPAFLNGFKKKFNSIMQYLSMTMSIHQVMAQLRKGIQYVREIDLALTELKKVTDETEETYDKFLDTAAKTGERLGSTISAVTEATATFAKLGYSMAQATEMAEAAIVYKNVGDNIASTEDAADSIISTMKGFKLEATEAMRIVDRFNEVGNRFAITSQGIGEALRLSASALSEGGNSLDESIGLITAAM